MNEYVKYALSMQLKELAINEFYPKGTNVNDVKRYHQFTKPVYYAKPGDEKSYEHISSLSDVLEQLINSGASCLIKDQDNELVLKSVITSRNWYNSHKLQIINSIAPEEMALLSEKEMNNLFIEVAKHSLTLQPHDLQEWENLLDKLFEKGLNYIQGKDVMSNDISQVFNGNLRFFEMLAYRVPTFNFEYIYTVNENNGKTLSQLGETYLAEARTNVDKNVYETVQFIKSFSMYNKMHQDMSKSNTANTISKKKI